MLTRKSTRAVAGTLAVALGCSLDSLPHILLAREPSAAYLEVEARALADAWGAEAWRMIALLRLAQESATAAYAGAGAGAAQ